MCCVIIWIYVCAYVYDIEFILEEKKIRFNERRSSKRKRDNEKSERKQFVLCRCGVRMIKVDEVNWN